MSKVQIFNNMELGNVRVLDIDGEPWFVGKDVAEILGYERGSKTVVDRVHEDDRKMLDGKTQSYFGTELGQRGGWLINESGVYTLIFSSKLESAKKFQRWVTKEVLPAIRKQGYFTALSPEQTIELLRQKMEEDGRFLKKIQLDRTNRRVLTGIVAEEKALELFKRREEMDENQYMNELTRICNDNMKVYKQEIARYTKWKTAINRLKKPRY